MLGQAQGAGLGAESGLALAGGGSWRRNRGNGKEIRAGESELVLELALESRPCLIYESSGALSSDGRRWCWSRC